MKHKFKVGDRVQFKSWEEMEKEFGVDSNGRIDVVYGFTIGMKHLCNTYATVDSIEDDSVFLKDFTAKGAVGWCFCCDMLKPVKEEKKSNYEMREFAEFENIDEAIKYHEKRIAELKVQKEKERWVFTEDEKVILRNLPEVYKYIARDKDDQLYIYTKKPSKHSVEWWRDYMNIVCGIPMFNHVFQCIRWTDTEPCEFRKYI